MEIHVAPVVARAQGVIERRSRSGPSGRSNDPMIRCARGVQERRRDVLLSQIVKVTKQVLPCGALRKCLHDIRYTHPRTLDAWPTATHCRIRGDALQDEVVCDWQC